MFRERPREYSKYDDERDNESINCCQLDVHKQLIRERNASKYESTNINIFGKRSCTDILCLFVFIAAVIGWIVFAIIVFQNGGPQKLLAPVDSNNRRCGFDKGVEDRPKLFYFDITKCLPPRVNVFHCDTKQVCVTECPKTNFSTSYYLKRNMPLWLIKDKLMCVNEFNKNYQINSYVDVENAIRGGYCADWYMESQPSFSRCIPNQLLVGNSSLKSVTFPNKEDTRIMELDVLFDIIRSLSVKYVTKDAKVNEAFAGITSHFDFRGLLRVKIHAESENQIVGLCLPRYLSNPFKSDGYARIELPEGANVELKGVTPKLIQLGMNEVKRDEEFIRKVVQDLLKTWPWIVAFICLAMIISFIYIIIMRWISGIMVWTSLVALLCLLSFSSFYTWKNYAETKNKKGVVQNSKLLKFVAYHTSLNSTYDDLLKHEYTWLALFILSVSSLVIIAIILLFLRRRIMLAIQLIKEGSKAVSYAWTSLVFPLFPWALQLVIFFQGALIFCYLLGERIPIYRVTGLNGSDCTCSNNYKDGDICDIESFRNNCHGPFGDQCSTAKCNFSGNEAENFTIYLHLYNLLMFLWCEYFVSGFGQMSLALTFATYYWTAAKRKLPFCIVASSVFKVLQYHLGTIAFGSFLLALLNWLHVLVEFFYRYIKNNDNVIVRCLRCCCGCFLACLHKILRILTKNAYIMCAMKGSNYCTSARDAFSLIVRNIIRASVLDGVTTFLFFLMKLLITVSIGVIAYLIFSKPIPDFSNADAEGYEFEYYFVPIIIICLGSYLVASLFFSVYSTAVATIFLCALEDLDRNDGSQNRPYVMNKSLIKIFKVKNRRTS